MPFWNPCRFRLGFHLAYHWTTLPKKATWQRKVGVEEEVIPKIPECGLKTSHPMLP